MSSDRSPSLWELLSTIETKLIQSTHSLLPTIQDSSQEILDQLQLLSADAYQLATTHLHSLLPSNNNNTNTTTTTTTLPLQHHQLLHSDGLPSPASLQTNHFFRPRNLLLITAVLLSSRFSLRLFINSSYFDQWTRSNPALAQKIPRCLLTSSSRKAIKKRARRSSAATPTDRLEVIVVLGADPGSAASQIALHLTQIGYVVVASVSRAEYVASLEMEGLGWLKALVLDPLIFNQTRAFNRSLAACLNKFPLNSSDESRHQSSLVGLINCLPISFPDVLRPVESLDLDDHLISPIQSIAGLSLEVIKVVLPMIRNSIDKFGADDGVIVTLFPTKTTSVALPYLSSSVIANQTLETLMQTLRREIKISNSSSKQSIRIINEKIGSFRPSQHFTGSSIHHPTATHYQSLPSLPIHLHPIYAPSLSRRIGILSLPTTGLAILSPNGNPISQLIKRVQEIIQTPSIKTGSSISTGKEVWKFNTIQRVLPNVLVENWLILTESLNGWVRQKVLSDIDLESKENLEKLVQKRQFSSRSHWKNGIFLNCFSDNDDPTVQEVVVNNEKEGEGDMTIQNPPAPTKQETEQVPTTSQVEEALPNPPEFTSPTDSDNVEAETGSVIDKGEEYLLHKDDVDDLVPSHSLNQSFVGSEIDWNEHSNNNNSSSTSS